MAGRQRRPLEKDATMRDLSPTTTNIDVTIGGQLRIYLAYLRQRPAAAAGSGDMFSIRCH
jgi:hypothetical protein